MLHRYTDQERTVVRNEYDINPMMKVAEVACSLFDNRLQNFGLWPEELFAWVAVIMDDVKEQGDKYMTRIGNLWKVCYRELRAIDKSMPAEELQLTASLILYVPILMLRTSNDGVHRYMGKQMLDSVSMNYEHWEKTFVELAARCNRMTDEMGEWTNGFMALDNDLYLSDEIADMMEPPSADMLHDSGFGNTYVTVQPGGEYVARKTVEHAIGKVEAGGVGIKMGQGTGGSKGAKVQGGGTAPAFKVVSGVFTYKWARQHPERITSFYQYLVKLRAIDKDTDHEEFEKLFTGEPTDLIVRWLAPKSALKALMSELKEREYITFEQGIWVTTESHFKDKDNQLFKNLRKEHSPQKLGWIINRIADTLDPQKDVQSIDVLEDDMADELWSGIRDKGFDL